MLTITELSVRFGAGQGRPMVDGVCLSLARGQTLAVVGETGSGKSLMALSICGLLPPEAEVEGTVWFDGTVLSSLQEGQMRHLLGRRIAYVPQSAGLSLNPTMRCDRQVAEVLSERQDRSRRVASRSARRLLADLGLSSGSRFPHLLSGGMKQRVLVGIGLAAQPDLLIADEPTKGLDQERRSDIIALFRDLRCHKPDMSLLLITHDLALAEAIADQVAVMYAGQLVEQSPKGRFFRLARHPYSRALLAALPERGLRPVPGMAPRAGQALAGCPFHPRCPEVLPRCRESRPPGLDHGAGRICCWRHA
jgi:peptide/nickel transport system ATP-binding protein